MGILLYSLMWMELPYDDFHGQPLQFIILSFPSSYFVTYTPFSLETRVCRRSHRLLVKGP